MVSPSELHAGVEAAPDESYLSKRREGFAVGEVVDGDDLQVAALGESGAEVVAADAAEAVDSDPDGHVELLSVVE